MFRVSNKLLSFLFHYSLLKVMHWTEDGPCEDKLYGWLFYWCTDVTGDFSWLHNDTSLVQCCLAASWLSHHCLHNKGSDISNWKGCCFWICWTTSLHLNSPSQQRYHYKVPFKHSKVWIILMDTEIVMLLLKLVYIFALTCNTIHVLWMHINKQHIECRMVHYHIG